MSCMFSQGARCPSSVRVAHISMQLGQYTIGKRPIQACILNSDLGCHIYIVQLQGQGQPCSLLLQLCSRWCSWYIYRTAIGESIWTQGDIIVFIAIKFSVVTFTYNRLNNSYNFMPIHMHNNNIICKKHNYNSIIGLVTTAIQCVWTCLNQSLTRLPVTGRRQLHCGLGLCIIMRLDASKLRCRLPACLIYAI